MRPDYIENAVITGTMLGFEGHGILTAVVTLEGAAWGQSFGGYAFDQWDRDTNRRIGHAVGAEFIGRLLKTVGVERWEDLKGKVVRVKREMPAGPIVAVGHIVEDKWFTPNDDMRNGAA